MAYSSNPRSISGYGRPRDTGATDRIHDAAIELSAERGYAGATIGAIAARAGTGTKTIYRRYMNRTELLVGALSERLGMIEFANTGDTSFDLVSMLAPGDKPHIQRLRSMLAAAVMTEKERHPELLMEFRRRFVWPWRRSLESVLTRAVRRGEIRDDVDLDVVIDLLIGGTTARYLSGGDLEVGLSGKYLRMLLDGCARPQN